MADYEFLGVDAIKRLLAKTSRIRGFINEKDKEPSWDGNIYLFEKPDVKENIKKIPTQVKGKNKNHHNKKKYNHYFDKADLENYYNDGGVLYFSTNSRQLVWDPEKLPKVTKRNKIIQITDLTLQTIPEDFRNKKIHRCWKLVIGK